MNAIHLRATLLALLALATVFLGLQFRTAARAAIDPDVARAEIRPRAFRPRFESRRLGHRHVRGFQGTRSAADGAQRLRGRGVIQQETGFRWIRECLAFPPWRARKSMSAPRVTTSLRALVSLALNTRSPDGRSYSERIERHGPSGS